MLRKITFIGGPFDGKTLRHNERFKPGDIITAGKYTGTPAQYIVRDRRSKAVWRPERGEDRGIATTAQASRGGIARHA